MTMSSAGWVISCSSDMVIPFSVELSGYLFLLRFRYWSSAVPESDSSSFEVYVKTVSFLSRRFMLSNVGFDPVNCWVSPSQ